MIWVPKHYFCKKKFDLFLDYNIFCDLVVCVTCKATMIIEHKHKSSAEIIFLPKFVSDLGHIAGSWLEAGLLSHSLL